MATETATKWSDVLNIISNASGSTTIDIVNDIDANDEYPSGAPIRVTGSASITINGTVNGSRHKIKNLAFHINSSSTVFEFYSPGKLTFKDIDIEMTAENDQSSTNSVYLFNRVKFDNASLLIQAIGSVYISASRNSEVLTASLSGIRIEGVEGTNGTPALNVYDYIADCNLYLAGKFSTFYVSCRRCFIDGDFSGSNVQFDWSSTSVIAAKINASGTISNTSGSNCPIDMRNITGTVGSAGFLKCNAGQGTPDIKSPSDLAAAGFPIVAETIGE